MYKILSVTAALAAASMLFGNAAQATLMIEISDGSTTKLLVDNTANLIDPTISDFDARVGVLGANTTIGEFSLVLTLAQSKPFIGGVDDPVIDMTFAVTSFIDGGTLTIKFSDSGFTSSAPGRGACRIGGVSSGTVGYSCFLDSGDTELATTTELASLGPLSGAFAGSEGFEIGAVAGFALTDMVTIIHDPGFQITTGNANARIPEPGSLALFGVGLLGLGFLARRRKAWPLAG